MDDKIRISVVTASYNMVDYIGRTIGSIVSQNYSNLEYIVVDGGSTDGTADVIRSYENRISKIVSEPDEGQYHAIQKGMDMATGEVSAWLNADDIYFPWTFSIVDEVFRTFPDVQWIVGLPAQVNKLGQCISIASGVSAYPQKFIRNGWCYSYLGPHLQQESMFWRRSLWEKVGGLDLKWKYAADFELWTRFAQFAEPVAVTVPLAAFCVRPGEQVSATKLSEYHEEVLSIRQALKRPPLAWDQIARRGLFLRCFCRLAIWKKCSVIMYSVSKERWVIRSLHQPISRSGLRSLLLESAVRCN